MSDTPDPSEVEVSVEGEVIEAVVDTTLDDVDDDVDASEFKDDVAADAVDAEDEDSPNP